MLYNKNVDVVVVPICSQCIEDVEISVMLNLVGNNLRDISRSLLSLVDK